MRKKRKRIGLLVHEGKKFCKRCGYLLSIYNDGKE
jgi:hypothetical protein